MINETTTAIASDIASVNEIFKRAGSKTKLVFSPTMNRKDLIAISREFHQAVKILYPMTAECNLEKSLQISRITEAYNAVIHRIRDYHRACEQQAAAKQPLSQIVTPQLPQSNVVVATAARMLNTPC